MSLSIIHSADQRIYGPPQRLLEQRGRMVRTGVPTPITVPPQPTARPPNQPGCHCGPQDSYIRPPHGTAREERGVNLASPPPPDPRRWRGWVRWLFGI